MSTNIWTIDNNTENLESFRKYFSRYDSYTLHEVIDNSLINIDELRSKTKNLWPRMIFLSLDFENGYQTLEKLKSENAFKAIPVISYNQTINTSKLDFNLLSTGNAHIQLDNQMHENLAKIEKTCNYWLNCVKLAY